jgi:hypothetical protein
VSIVAPLPQIASAYLVHYGRYGDIRRAAQQRGVCRQWIYREATRVVATLQGTRQRQQREQLRQQVRALQRRLAELEQRLAQAVVLDSDKQAEFAAVGQAEGVSLPDLHTLLEVLLPGRAPSVATLGRWTQVAGARSAALLAVLDEQTQPHVAQAVIDELYVSRPVLMVVEPESLCWVSGRLTEVLTGAVWTEEWGRLPRLQQVARDAGSCLGKGVADLNRQRQEQGQPAIADQLDHFHVLREGGRGVGRAERAAQRIQVALAKAEADLARRQWRGQPVIGASNRARALRAKAGPALEAWVERDTAWQQAKEAVPLFTAEGQLNTRAQAEARLAEALPRLPDADFATAKRLLQRPQTLTYLDEVERKLAALPVPAAVREAAVRQEGLRRRPELLRGEGGAAAARRGLLLVCAVVLAQAGEVGQQAVQGLRAALRSSWRASSLVECVNSVVRMQQARHRKLSQGLLDLKRLYWNSQPFRTGRRQGQSPYQRLGVPWPEGVRWWELLQWSPEQLRKELSTAKKAG